ncbi:gamma-glutamylcyclotransferase [Pseudooceanicola onchidii]|uniref:gamma-glutamylcyclotransferase n=1 Tax=Pseudooceanicola onchidii TaxID=2562279 RepID=UPI0010AA3FB7|nr:gamma-glutamylcyclotransferase [Pseudooceanicola onchidii]
MAGPVRVFLFGTLRHPPLLEAVAGQAVPTRPAQLPGWQVHGVAGQVFPILIEEPGQVAQGEVVEVTPEVLDRLVHYEDAFGYVLRDVTVHIDGADHPAKLFVPEVQDWSPAGEWSLDTWVEKASARAIFGAAEIMGYMGRFAGPALQFRRGQVEARAHGRVDAGQMSAPKVGWDQTGDQVVVNQRAADHAGYFVTETVNLRHPTFSGGMSDAITREVFLSADAAIVLPYDPVRDRILLVEQFRMGPWARGARYPWMLEPVAGRIDPGESAEDCMRREAEEEAGITLGRLIKIGSGYPTPGYSTEYFHIYCGLCDLPDGSEGRHGVATEHEDIRTHVLTWAQAEDLLSRGEANNIPLVLALTWLSRERPHLRASG